MEAIIFCGIQATGKTTFYVQHFLNSHVRISMDLLHTRNKENIMLRTCLKMQQRFVIDNTNPTVEERKKYIDLAKKSFYKIIGYYFHATAEEALQRNQYRSGKARIPIAGIRGTFKKLQRPSYQEGFDQIYTVEINADNQFVVKEWQNEILKS